MSLYDVCSAAVNVMKPPLCVGELGPLVFFFAHFP